MSRRAGTVLDPLPRPHARRVRQSARYGHQTTRLNRLSCERLSFCPPASSLKALSGRCQRGATTRPCRVPRPLDLTIVGHWPGAWIEAFAGAGLSAYFFSVRATCDISFIAWTLAHMTCHCLAAVGRGPLAGASACSCQRSAIGSVSRGRRSRVKHIAARHCSALRRSSPVAEASVMLISETPPAPVQPSTMKVAESRWADQSARIPQGLTSSL